MGEPLAALLIATALFFTLAVAGWIGDWIERRNR